MYRSEFHEIFADERRDSEFGPLLQRMKVVNARGDSAMTEDQWDAASESYCSPLGCGFWILVGRIYASGFTCLLSFLFRSVSVVG